MLMVTFSFMQIFTGIFNCIEGGSWKRALHFKMPLTSWIMSDRDNKKQRFICEEKILLRTQTEHFRVKQQWQKNDGIQVDHKLNGSQQCAFMDCA